MIEVDPLTDGRWEAFVDAHPDAVAYHHPAWLAVLLREVTRPLRGLACVGEDGEWLGVLALVETRGLPLRRGHRTRRRLSSLPRTPYSGPLARCPRAAHALVEAAAAVARDLPGTWLEIKLAPGSDLRSADLPQVSWRPTYRVDLPEDPSALRWGGGRNRRRVQWACRRARSLGIELRVAESLADIHAWYPLYLESLRAHVVPPRPLRLFEAAWEVLAPREMLRILLAERRSGNETEVIAGSVFVHGGSTVFYAFDGRRHDEEGSHASDLIQWEAIRWASEAGYRVYDMGEVPDGQSGLVAFKHKFGASPVPLTRLYLPAPAREDGDRDPTSVASRLERAAWRHVPLPATAWAGDLIYRRG